MARKRPQGLCALGSGGMALQFGPEDQRNINTFSKLNTELHELNAMMSVQQVRRRSSMAPHCSGECQGECTAVV